MITLLGISLSGVFLALLVWTARDIDRPARKTMWHRHN